MSSRSKHICLVCQKEFYKWRYEKNRKCCSAKCGNYNRRKTQLVSCLGCGKEFCKPSAEIKRSNRNFCSQKCYHKYNVGVNSSKYIGGHITTNGYREVYFNKEKILEHRHLIEEHLGRKLTTCEVVHHANGNKLDNRIENLIIMTNNEHRILHGRISTWSRKHECCLDCKTKDRRHEAHGLCSRCYQKNRQKIQSRKNSPPSHEEEEGSKD